MQINQENILNDLYELQQQKPPVYYKNILKLGDGGECGLSVLNQSAKPSENDLNEYKTSQYILTKDAFYYYDIETKELTKITSKRKELENWTQLYQKLEKLKTQENSFLNNENLNEIAIETNHQRYQYYYVDNKNLKGAGNYGKVYAAKQILFPKINSIENYYFSDKKYVVKIIIASVITEFNEIIQEYQNQKNYVKTEFPVKLDNAYYLVMEDMGEKLNKQLNNANLVQRLHAIVSFMHTHNLWSHETFSTGEVIRNYDVKIPNTVLQTVPMFQYDLIKLDIKMSNQKMITFEFIKEQIEKIRSKNRAIILLNDELYYVNMKEQTLTKIEKNKQNEYHYNENYSLLSETIRNHEVNQPANEEQIKIIASLMGHDPFIYELNPIDYGITETISNETIHEFIDEKPQIIELNQSSEKIPERHVLRGVRSDVYSMIPMVPIIIDALGGKPSSSLNLEIRPNENNDIESNKDNHKYHFSKKSILNMLPENFPFRQRFIDTTIRFLEKMQNYDYKNRATPEDLLRFFVDFYQIVLIIDLINNKQTKNVTKKLYFNDIQARLNNMENLSRANVSASLHEKALDGIYCYLSKNETAFLSYFNKSNLKQARVYFYALLNHSYSKDDKNLILFAILDKSSDKELKKIILENISCQDTQEALKKLDSDSNILKHEKVNEILTSIIHSTSSGHLKRVITDFRNPKENDINDYDNINF